TKFRAIQRQYGATQHHHQQVIADLATRLEHVKAWLAEKKSQIPPQTEALEAIYANRVSNDGPRGLSKLRRSPTQPRFEGLLDYPKSEAAVTDRIDIYGWVYSDATGVTSVQAFLNDIYLGIVRYGIERPDVADAF